VWHFLRFQLTAQLVTADEAGAVPFCIADHRPAAPIVFLAVAIDLTDNRLKDDQIAALALAGVAGV
jgi:hypothetical protein